MLEALDRFDLVAEEIDANRQAHLLAIHVEFAGEIDIDDPAAHREIAWYLDLLQAVIAVLGQPDDQLFRLRAPGLS